MRTQERRTTRAFDRRLVLSDDQWVEIKERHKNGESIRSLALLFGVSRRCIDFRLFPEKYADNVKRRKERGGWRQYHDKDTNWATQKEHRHYLATLHNSGLI